VCEDLSKGGIAFRSRNEYPKGTRVEVAVPFTPGAGAIFVPIRIVFSEPIRSAGLFDTAPPTSSHPNSGMNTASFAFCWWLETLFAHEIVLRYALHPTERFAEAAGCLFLSYMLAIPIVLFFAGLSS